MQGLTEGRISICVSRVALCVAGTPPKEVHDVAREVTLLRLVIDQVSNINCQTHFTASRTR